MIPKATAATLAFVLSVAGVAYAQDAAMPPSPDFSESVGQWDIEGLAPGKGNTIICKMQKEAADGSPFADIAMMSTGYDGFNFTDAYISKTALPEGSTPKVAIYFDGKKTTELTGGVTKGYLHADIAKLKPLAMVRNTQLFRSSKSLVEIATLKGHPSEKITVDLTDADAAFAKRGMCLKAVLDVGLARMKAANADNPACWGDNSRQDITCTEITEKLLLGLRGQTIDAIREAMKVPGREIANGLHFLSNYSRGEKTGSGDVNVIFEDGRAIIVNASVDSPSNVGQFEFIWNAYATPPLGKEIDRSTKNFGREPFCSDFSSDPTKCKDNESGDRQFTLMQMQFGLSKAELLQTLEISCNPGNGLAISDPAGDCARLRDRLR